MAEISRLPLPIAEEWDWQRLGACREFGSESFFHPDNERGPARLHRETSAKAVCGVCPVRAQCLQHSLTVQEAYGTWGGVTEIERAVLIKRLRRAVRDEVIVRTEPVVPGQDQSPSPGR